MKKISIVLFLVVVLTIFIAMNDKKEKGDIVADTHSTVAIKDGVYYLDSASSTIVWTGGKKLVLGYFDSGMVNISSSSLEFSGGKILNGEVSIDMNTIETSKTGSGGGFDGLTKHLKSKDFFDVVAFPFSILRITGSEATSTGLFIVYGELEIKGVKKAVSFEAGFSPMNGNVLVEGKMTINRTDFGVKYGSESFFKGLGDKIINDDFILDFSLMAYPVKDGF